MNTNLQTVREHLDRIDIKYDLDEEKHFCLAGIGLNNLQGRLVIHAPPDADIVTLLLILPVLAPPERRGAVGEFFLRLNHQLRLGAFELDFEDGEMRFRLAACLGDTALTDEMMGQWIATAATTVDGFFPALMRVLFAGMKPDQAVEQGEGFLRDLLKRLGADPE